MENQSLIAALAINYLNVYEVNVETNKGSIVKLNGYIFEGITDFPKEFDYEPMLANYASGRVYPQDLSAFLNALSTNTLKTVFNGDRKLYEYSYRILESNVIHYYTASYTRLSKPGEDLVVVAGFRNIDDLMKVQEEKHTAGLNQAYKALASIYQSMFRIDIKNDTFYSIKSSDSIANSIQATYGDYSATMRHAVKDLCTLPFKQGLLDFLDSNTLDERLKDKDQITYEFISRTYGWCRGIIIKEDCDLDGSVRHIIYAIEAIDTDKQREQALAKAAQTDLLTGIYNRGYGEHLVNELVQNNTSGFFAILDCDHFKNINDTYGHQMGDKVISSIAKALEDASSKNDIVFRLGGDEFAIFSSNIHTLDEVELFFENIKSKVKKIKIDGIENNFVLSLGGTFANSICDTFSSLYNKADDAMYESKLSEGFTYTIK